jgi:phosphoribosylamine-glycine ligase|tara:strand:+ start:173 stop:481 length:309 start_codon:yes stop_codon:yes gene_type:complete
MNFDNMSEEQYNKFIDDIAGATVKLMIKKQAEYDAELKMELEKKYGYVVEFNAANPEYPDDQDLLLELEDSLQSAIDEERYEDAEELKKQINQLNSKQNDKN